jgi:hypothetical protein
MLMTADRTAIETEIEFSRGSVLEKGPQKSLSEIVDRTVAVKSEEDRGRIYIQCFERG